jgi:hypothetical protein
MPETKKINEVEKVVKDILDRVVEMEKNNDKILELTKERDNWKKKYDDLKLLYDKCYF